MTAPKRARVYIASVEVHCPTCEQPIAHPETGSFLWDVNDGHIRSDVRCLCGQPVRVQLTATMRKLT